MIALARAWGLRIFGATLLPFQGTGYYTAAGEVKREAVNAWIRHSGAFDGVIDFGKALRDPADPLRLNPGYDSGDHLHPNDAGYQAMANAVSLGLLLAGQGPRRTPKPSGRPELAAGLAAGTGRLLSAGCILATVPGRVSGSVTTDLRAEWKDAPGHATPPPCPVTGGAGPVARLFRPPGKI